MGSGVLKIFEFLNRGQRLRRGQPSEMELDDRDLKRSLAMRGENRAELSSALSALDKLDELKNSGFAMREKLGGLSEADYLHRAQREREEDRQISVDTRAAHLKRLQQDPQDPEIEIDEGEAAELAKHGVRLPAGKISPSVLSSVVGLRGHEMSAAAAASRMGIPGIGDARDEATLKYWSDMVDRNPAVLSAIPSTRGNDIRSAVVAYRARTGVAVPTTIKMREASAGFADAEAGLNQIEKAFKDYNDSSIFSPAKANRARYAYTNQARNYATLLGKAREKGLVTEPDYQRFLDLIYPGLIAATVDPKLAQEALDNARNFLRETKERRLAELGGPNPGGGGDATGGSLADQLRAELARRKAGGGR